MSEQFEPKKDMGRLMSTQSKKTEQSPDYWGEIAIDIKNMTNVTVVNGLYVIKLSGWKRKSKSGQTYLSMAVNRYVPEGKTTATQDPDDEIPF